MSYSLEEESEVIKYSPQETISFLVYCIVKDNCKSPFLLFLLEQDQTLTIPYHICTHSEPLASLAKTKFQGEYKGIIWRNQIPYALVKVQNTNINMNAMECEFAMPSEIINQKHVWNISVDPFVSQLFTEFPEMGLLRNEKKQYYNLPDVGYVGDSLESAKYQSVFGTLTNRFYLRLNRVWQEEYIIRYAVFSELSDIVFHEEEEDTEYKAQEENSVYLEYRHKDLIE
jgi:hypothetical protein